MVARAPRKRMYRTMQGRMIDIEKLRGANEDVRAVGNMNVNARGDVLNKSGQVVGRMVFPKSLNQYQFVEFLTELRKKVGTAKITLSIDNLPLHKTKFVKAKALDLGIELLFFPPYSS